MNPNPPLKMLIVGIFHTDSVDRNHFGAKVLHMKKERKIPVTD